MANALPGRRRLLGLGGVVAWAKSSWWRLGGFGGSGQKMPSGKHERQNPSVLFSSVQFCSVQFCSVLFSSVHRYLIGRAAILRRQFIGSVSAGDKVMVKKYKEN